MSRYVGKKCVICDKTFADSDDIVVCPDCGTPYHRDCYSAAGKCVAEGLHEKGTSWHDFQVETGKILICKNCSHENSSESLFCEKCGKPTKMQESTQNQPNNNNRPFVVINGQSVPVEFAFMFDEYCGISPEEDFDGVKLKEIADFVGPNKHYYLPIFKVMKDTNKKFSMNLPAIIFPHYYFAYRKMYFPMFVALLSSIVLELQWQFEYIKDSSTLIYRLVSQNPKLLEALLDFGNSDAYVFISGLLMYLSLAVSIIFACFSNWIYYRHCIKKIKSIKSKKADAKTRNSFIKKCGGTTFAGILLAFMFLMPFLALTIAQNLHMM